MRCELGLSALTEKTGMPIFIAWLTTPTYGPGACASNARQSIWPALSSELICETCVGMSVLTGPITCSLILSPYCAATSAVPFFQPSAIAGPKIGIPVPSIESTKLSGFFAVTLLRIELFRVNAPDGSCTVVGGPAAEAANDTDVRTKMPAATSPTIVTRAAMTLLSRLTGGNGRRRPANRGPETDSRILGSAGERSQGGAPRARLLDRQTRSAAEPA